MADFGYNVADFTDVHLLFGDVVLSTHPERGAATGETLTLTGYERVIVRL